MSTIQERVQRGAQWLDEVRPGWRDAINLETLDLASLTGCVLGQVFAEEIPGHEWKFSDGFSLGCFVMARTGHEFESSEMAFNYGYVERTSTLLAERMERTEEWRRVIHASRIPADTLAEATT